MLGDILDVIGTLSKGISEAVEAKKAGNELEALRILDEALDTAGGQIRTMFEQISVNKETIKRELDEANKKDPVKP